MVGLAIGRIVHFMPGEGHGRWRKRRCIPAIIVQEYPGNTASCNIQVFADGSNDGQSADAPVVWETSVVHGGVASEAQSSWHFHEECAGLGRSD